MYLNSIEQTIYKIFEDEPFHNLYQRYGLAFPKYRMDDGGSCSVKSLSAQRRLLNLTHCNIATELHDSIVHFNNHSYRHLVLKITHHGCIYFADIGNGWPAIKLFPTSHNIKFHCAGIGFYSKLYRKIIKIYQARDGKSFHYLTIPLTTKSEFHSKRQINEHFNHFNENRAPNKELRFAQIIDNQFLFLRGNQINVYHEDYKKKYDISSKPIAEVLEKYFRFQLEEFLRVHHE